VFHIRWRLSTRFANKKRIMLLSVFAAWRWAAAVPALTTLDRVPQKASSKLSGCCASGAGSHPKMGKTETDGR